MYCNHCFWNPPFCRDLSESVCALPAGTSSFEAECLVLKRVLAIGGEAMKAFFATQAGYYHWPRATNADGQVLRYSDERRGLFYSIFGDIEFKRSYYCGDGRGMFPMDAALNLPPKGASDLHRMMLEELSLSMSYEDAAAFLAKYFPVATSTRAVQESVRTDSIDAQAYYDQAPTPVPISSASILAVQADGKGVPVVKRSNDAQPEPGRPKGPPKRDGKKKEATVVSVSAHTPFFRTAEQVVRSLFDKEPVHHDAPCSVAFKREWATMDGKWAALTQAQTWAGQIDGDHVTDHVTLCDGLPSLQRAVDEAFPGYTRVLDLMHAIGYLWKAADAWFGGSSKHGAAWVRDSVLIMLQGQTARIIDEVDQWSRQARTGKLALEGVANYLRKNIHAMAYDQYLAKGWPIATGIIEGACRHIVKDRCERSGMRWTGEGVEAILHLRCVYANGDWEQYHQFRMARRRHNIYRMAPPPQTLLETDVHKFNTTTQFAEAI
jgi:hypothetical protein